LLDIAQEVTVSVDHPLPWLRCVKTSDLHDKTIPFDRFDVRNVAGENLGDVNGFSCVDATVTAVESPRWNAHAHYRRPDWWDNSFYRPELAGEAGMPPETWGVRESTLGDPEPSMLNDRQEDRK
jgi:hypothetical protein